MPLPKPRKDEDRNTYVSRCIRFVHRESTKKREPAQIQAMCIGNWEKHHEVATRFQASPLFKTLGNALIIEGDLIRPGTFIGLDGVPTHYSDNFIHRIAPSIIGTPIRFAHEISPKSMLKRIEKGTTIGFWTGFKKGGTLKVRGYTFDPIAIEYLKSHPKIGLSMEAQVYAEYNPKLGVEDAKSGKLTGGVLIDDPACPTCRVTNIREVSLETRIKNKKMKGVLNVTDEDEELEEELEEEEEELGLEKPFLEFSEKQDLAKPTRGSFFTWLEEGLNKSGIKEAVAKKIVAAIAKSMTTPFQVAAPKAMQDDQATDEKTSQDLWEKVKAALKAAGLDEATISKVISALKGVVKVPYPGPAKEDETALAKKLAEVQASLKKLSDERATEKAEALSKTLGEVKEIDKDFDEKILESIECPDAKQVFLEKYLANLKRTVKPIQLQIGKTKAEGAVSTAVKEMFGDQTFNQIFDIPEEGK